MYDDLGKNPKKDNHSYYSTLLWKKEEDFSRSCPDFPNPVKIDPVQGKRNEIFVANLCESFRGYVIILSVDEKLPAFLDESRRINGYRDVCRRMYGVSKE